MGTIIHHAILVTAGDYKPFAKIARDFAVELFGEEQVSDIHVAPVNGYESFTVFPDGSKEGWIESNEGDSKRDNFIEWLNGQRYGDGSTPYAWVEVAYGEVGPEYEDGAEIESHYGEVVFGDEYSGTMNLETEDTIAALKELRAQKAAEKTQ